MKKLFLFSLILLLVSTSVLAQPPLSQSHTQTFSESETEELLNKIIKAHEDIKSFYIKQTCVHSYNIGTENGNSDTKGNTILEIVLETWYRFPYIRCELNHSTQTFSSLHLFPPVIKLIDQQKEIALYYYDDEKSWEQVPFDELFHYGINKPLHLGNFFSSIMLAMDENKSIDSTKVQQADEKTIEYILLDEICDGDTCHYLLKTSFIIKRNDNTKKVYAEYVIDPQTYLVVGIYSEDIEITHGDMSIEEHLTKGYSWHVETTPNPDIPDRIFEEIINH